MEKLINILIDGDEVLAINEVESMLSNGISRERIIKEGIESAMLQLNDKCTVDHFNLLEIMLTGRAIMSVMKILYPADQIISVQKKVTVSIAALEGDVHDLGKNIFKTILSASGYSVDDLGKDCPLSRLIASAIEKSSIAIGVTGLITTIVPSVLKIKTMLAEQNASNIKVIAGGAVLKQFSAEKLNVDYVAQDPFDGLQYLAKIMELADE